MQVLRKIEKCVDACYALFPRAKPQINLNKEICVIAHRGAHDWNKDIQENTVAAFNKALELNCFGIEFDIHATKDNVLVINHDPTLERFWNTPLKIGNINFSEVRKYATNLPTLTEVVEQFGKKIHLFIELKSPFIAFDTLQKALSPLEPAKDYHLLSLQAELLPDVAKKFPKNCLFLISVHNNTKKFHKIGLQENYAGVLSHYFLLQKKQIKKLIANQQIVGTGFVDSKFSLYREINRGVQYLFSNNVEEIMQHLYDLVHPNQENDI